MCLRWCGQVVWVDVLKGKLDQGSGTQSQSVQEKQFQPFHFPKAALTVNNVNFAKNLENCDDVDCVGRVFIWYAKWLFEDSLLEKLYHSDKGPVEPRLG